MKSIVARLALLLGAGAAACAVAADPPGGLFQPPALQGLADDDYGRMVRLGENIMLHTDRYAAAYVGNRLHCANCHLDGGRRADSGPLWGAYGLYPQYRAKTRQVDTFAARLQGCFQYSMNGKAPPLGDPVLVALESYASWMARGAPHGVRLQGQGYPRLAPAALTPDYARGAGIYQARCAQCHGADGAGRHDEAGETLFPALWGAGSFNWGAGMGEVDKAAGFIKANMPLGQGGSLSDQQAWDTALYIDSQSRPQDPRYTGDVAGTRARYHDSPYSEYGLTVNGRVLGGDPPAR